MNQPISPQLIMIKDGQSIKYHKINGDLSITNVALILAFLYILLCMFIISNTYNCCVFLFRQSLQ